MTLSPMVTEWAEAYEQEYSKKPAALVMRIAEHILKVSEWLSKQGENDARQGKRAPTANFFHALVINVFRFDVAYTHEAVTVVAALWESSYMDGYRKLHLNQ